VRGPPASATVYSKWRHPACATKVCLANPSKWWRGALLRWGGGHLAPRGAAHDVAIAG